MKVAVASQDGITVSQHFGRSKCFIVFDVENGEILDSQVRADTFSVHAAGECEAERGLGSNGAKVEHTDMVKTLQDCHVVLCRGMGWRAAEELVRRGINPMVIRGELSPQEAVQHYLDGKLTPAHGFCRCHK